MWRRLAGRSELVFGLVFAWKLALLVFTAQPIPANDAFFYDGPAVNFILNGHYTNPSLALTLPFSGTTCFSAYPPVYQAVLIGWMKAFGTSALSAMSLHLLLYGVYMLVVLAILRRLKTPIWGIHLAGLFLLANTFHDRPDSVCHSLGILAAYVALRSIQSSEGRKSNLGIFLAVGIAVIGLFAGPVLGALYISILACLILFYIWRTREFTAVWPLILLGALPVMIIFGLKSSRPDLWAGFLEHANQTPSLSKFHAPSAEGIAKTVRTVPGILVTILGIALLLKKVNLNYLRERTGVTAFGLVITLAALGVIIGSQSFLTANLVLVAGYLQPLVVGCFFSFFAPLLVWRRAWVALFISAGVLASVRALGMTTWGTACATDVSYARAKEIVSAELTPLPSGTPVVLSAAFLYEASTHRNIICVHSDWLGPMKRGEAFSYAAAVRKLRPAKIVVTQFEYYRRYETVIAELKNQPELASIEVADFAKVRPPDSLPKMQRVIQHVAWAPLVVTFQWKPPE